MTYVKDAVRQQFGNVALNYSTSTVHASGEDLDRMIRAVELTGSERVLDAGCGAGHTALAFAPRVAQVVAYDLTPPMLSQVERLAAERYIQNIVVRVGDVEHLPFEDNSFDLVVSRYSAHHWPHPKAALDEFMRVLKPGGHVILGDIVAPNDPTLDTFLQTIELLRDLSHVRDHSISQWQVMLDAAGLTGEVIYHWALSLNFESWVLRMATPAPNVSMIKILFDNAPQEVRYSLGIQPNYDFKIPGALFLARRNR